MNNSKFGDYVDRIDHIELKIWDTLDKERSASYLDVHTEEDRLTTKLYHKKKELNSNFYLEFSVYLYEHSQHRLSMEDTSLI